MRDPYLQAVRRKIPVQDGWIQEFTGLPRANKSVVLFIHGLGGHHTKTWDALIDKLERVPPLSFSDVASFYYRTGKFDRRNLDDVVAQLKPWCLANLEGYRAIFVITHSFGGIVTRRLLLDLHQTGEALFGAFRHVIMLAVPLGGSRMALIVNRFTLGMLNKKLDILELGNIRLVELRNEYQELVNRCIREDKHYPTTTIYHASSDRLVPKVVNEVFLTSSDTVKGTLPGSHSGLITPKIENSTVVTLLAIDLARQLAPSAVISDPGNNDSQGLVEFPSSGGSLEKSLSSADGASRVIESYGRSRITEVWPKIVQTLNLPIDSPIPSSLAEFQMVLKTQPGNSPTFGYEIQIALAAFTLIEDLERYGDGK